MSKAKQLICGHCNQPITDKVALENERKRLAQKVKDEAAEKAAEKAADEAEGLILRGIKQINSKKGIIRLSLHDFSIDDDPKAPLYDIEIDVDIKGVASNSSMDYKDALKMLRALGAEI